MRQILTGVVTLILGFFTLVFAAVFGLLISVGALIAKPFVMKKLRKAQEQQAAQFEQAYSENRETPFGPKARHQGQTIDGDYQDITNGR
ncbi:hypothetical protein K6Q96_22535 [Grimontia kaedaensis]|uniref:Uncharacterized protein n=1 Tax=Grimontia kaedaensis TaxID=2872157 RepID=A0ABY4WZV6_9GAMM|nr:hypothetical protein [Grimontia kaedaensis]USH04506.1 hypothetical protein K6Q96_22535 [Grimontia kaedaensis]